MVAIFGEYREPMERGYCFAMNDIEKFQVRHIYNPMQMCMFYLTFRFFGWFFIPSELVLDDCIYASPERFLDFL